MTTPKAEYRVLLNRRKRTKSRDGRFPIEIEAYIPNARERKYFPTHIKITPDRWNNRKKKDVYINRKHPNYHNLNNRIRTIIQGYEDIEQKYLEDRKPFHLQYLNQDDQKEKEQSFIKYWEDYIKANPMKRALNTIKAYKTALKTLKGFKENILFSELNKKLLLDYELYLLDYTYIKQNEEFNLKPSSVHRMFKDLQAAINRAIQEEIMQPQDSPFVSFKFSHYKNMEESEIRYLTPEEVQRIEDMEITREQKHLIKTRDLFLLSCYTGLRFCDITRLSRDHLVEKPDSMVISIKQQKTGKRVNLPIHKMFDRKPLYIVKAWIATGRKELVGSITNQYVNRNLKVIAAMSGIDKHLTFHMARHTCGTGLVSLRIPLIAIRDVMGHSSITMTEKYAKLIPTALEDQLESINY